MFHVYILENKSSQFYIGSTQNIKKRLSDHNDSTQKGWTKQKGPWKILYTEEFKTRTEALKREKFLKSLKAGTRIKTILHIPDKN